MTHFDSPLCFAGVTLCVAAACGTAGRAAEGALETRAQRLVPEASASYFLVRRDLRDCSPPRCGGYFVRSVNSSSTPCPSAGRALPECYVAALELSPLHATDSEEAELGEQLDSLLLRGALSAVAIPGSLDFGRLRVAEVWLQQNRAAPSGAFLRIYGESSETSVAPLGPFTMATLNQPAVPVARVELDWSAIDTGAWEPIVAQFSGEEGLIVTAEPGGVSAEADAGTAGAADAAVEAGAAPDAGAATAVRAAGDAGIALDPEIERWRVNSYYLPLPAAMASERAVPDHTL